MRGSTVLPLRATRRYFGGVVPLANDGYASYTAKDTPFSIFFYWFCNGWTVKVTFDRFQNSKTVTCFLPGFSPWKKELGFRNWKWNDQIFQIEQFWLTKHNFPADFGKDWRATIRFLNKIHQINQSINQSEGWSWKASPSSCLWSALATLA